jgi:sugar-specific transcriptional regulator TrmB
MGAYQALKDSGLTDYEALAYLGLVVRGPTTAKALSESTGIPNTRVYDVLGELERRGWVEVDASRPMRFRAKPPQEVLGVIRAEQQQRVGRVEEIIMKELLPVYETRAAENTDIWFIRSVPGMVNRIRSLVLSAKKELRLMMGHYETEVYGGIAGEVAETAKKKRVRAIVSEEVARTLSGIRLDGAEILIGAAVAPFNIILSDSGEVLFHLWSGLDSPPREEEELHGVRLGQVHREGHQGLHRRALLSRAGWALPFLPCPEPARLSPTIRSAAGTRAGEREGANRRLDGSSTRFHSARGQKPKPAGAPRSGLSGPHEPRRTVHLSGPPTSP